MQRGAAAVDALPKGIRANRTASQETIENNVRRVITDIRTKDHDQQVVAFLKGMS